MQRTIAIASAILASLSLAPGAAACPNGATACHSVCGVPGTRWICDLTNNGGAGLGVGFIVSDITAADFTAWGTDAAGNNFCCEHTGGLCEIILNGTPQADSLAFQYTDVNDRYGLAYEYTAACAELDAMIDGFEDDDVITGSWTDSTDYQETLRGNDDVDTIHGDDGDDIIQGGDGDDTIWGADGEDTIYGDDGEDYIRGGNHDDTIHGNGDSDVIWGGLGADTIYGDGGEDDICGDLCGDPTSGSGDTIWAGSGKDDVSGGGGPDVIHGVSGTNEICGDHGKDVLLGGEDQDSLWGGQLYDIAHGAAGGDLCNAENEISCDESGDLLTKPAGCP